MGRPSGQKKNASPHRPPRCAATILFVLPARRGSDDVPVARTAVTAVRNLIVQRNGVSARSHTTCCSAPLTAPPDSDWSRTPSTCRGNELWLRQSGNIASTDEVVLQHYREANIKSPIVNVVLAISVIVLVTTAV